MKDAIRSFARCRGFIFRKRKRDAVEKFLAMKAVRDIVAEDGDPLEAAFPRHVQGHFLESKAQIFQDLHTGFLCGDKEIFCEFGATDGVSLSNTWYLEQVRSWTGLLAEPAREWREKLILNRPNSIIDHRCVFDETGKSVRFLAAKDGEYGTIHTFSKSDGHTSKRNEGDVYSVRTVSLNDLLSEDKIRKLDFLSIDTKGPEYQILAKFEINRYKLKLIVVEHGFTNTCRPIFEIMKNAEYVSVFQQLSMFDDWYVREDVLA